MRWARKKNRFIMSAIDGFPTATRPAGLFARLNAAVQHWLDVRDTRNALYRLTDRELNDIGLSRVDIEHIARTA